MVVAAGWRSWELVAPFVPGAAGSAVMGQAALLAAKPGSRPLITAPGLYIVPHRHGDAVGSTGEPVFEDATTTGRRLDALIARARTVCPALAGAPVIRRWAGLRPKPPQRAPVAGRLPGTPGVWIAAGGHRIGLGIAHTIADAPVAEIAGAAAPVAPPAFRPAAEAPSD